MEANVMLKF